MLTKINPKLPMRDKAKTKEYYINKLGFSMQGSADYDGYLMLVKDGKKNGLWREFYDTGQLKTEGSYTLDKKNGIHREWEENGILLLEGYYAEGKANGLMKWYHEGGHLAAEGNMIDDVRIGNWKICDIEDNGFCIEAHFKNGMRDGIWKIYHENARDKLWKEQTFKEDRMISERCWDEKGKQIECQ